jgi:hypothetical protein
MSDSITQSTKTTNSWRGRQIELLGKAEFNKREAAKRKARRNTTKAPPVKSIHEDELINHIYAAKLKAANLKGQSIKKSSVVQQMRKVINLHKKIVGSPMINFNWVRDVKVLKFINDNFNTPLSRNAQIQALASVLSVLPEYKKTYMIYSKNSTKGSQNIKRSRENNKLNERESDFMEWGDLQKIQKKARSNRDKALLGLYIGGYLPPRRVEDVSLIKYTVCDTDNVNNWLVVGESGAHIIYNIYKNSKTYGQQVFEVPGELLNKLKSHIKTSKKKEGDLLFDSGNFSRDISNLFYKLADVHITVNIMRHSYISDFLKTNPSTKKKREVAYFMGHGKEIQETYNRIV